MKQATIKDLLALCKAECDAGNGDRIIVISDDNEGNSFHGMFYGFTYITESDKEVFPIYDSQEEACNKIVILG